MIGKRFHWMCVLDEEGELVLSRRVEASERDLEDCCEEIARLGGERMVGIDLLGGPATLLEAVLRARGERVFHLPGMAVNRARDGYRGEQKSDRRDALVIADQLRMRWRSLREVRTSDDASAELRALVAHRRGLVEDQARCITRLRALLLEVFPGLGTALDLKTDRALLVLTRVATPSAARRLGASRLARWLRDRGVRRSEELAGKVVEAAKAQRRELLAAEAKAALVAEMAAEVLRDRGRGRPRRPARGAAFGATGGRGGEEHAGHGPAVHRRVPLGGRGHEPVRLGGLFGRGGGSDAGDAAVGGRELPATSEEGKPHVEEPPVPLRLLLHRTPRAEQGLLPAKASGGQSPSPGRDRPRS